MKKTFTPALLLIALAQNPFTVSAQCNPAIPNTANVVSFSQTVNGGFTPQWVCSGDTLFSGGGIFFVYLEPGAVMETGGGIDTIYMKSGSVLNMNGGIHVMYFEPGAILNVSGGIPTYDTCVSVTFDYSNAPTSGCLITSVPEENSSSAVISIHPNPATNEIRVRSLKFIVQRVEVYDVLGQTAIRYQPTAIGQQQITLNVSALPGGIYFVRVKGEKEESVAKFVKE
ncbi:MAG: T9SS type A sorting domain-containing protein [Bacteroidia bacterium]|nr:T9SS type A sorting domain-containing protein [Bacteroidia bacterium]